MTYSVPRLVYLSITLSGTSYSGIRTSDNQYKYSG